MICRHSKGIVKYTSVVVRWYISNKITFKEKNLKKMRMIKGKNLSSQRSLHDKGGIEEMTTGVKPKN